MDGRGVQELQGGNCFPCTVFLYSADQDVGKHHEKEQHVPVTADQQQTQRQGQVQQVEKGQGMVQQDPGQTQVIRICHLVSAAGPELFFRLRSSQSGGVCKGKITGKFAGQGKIFSHGIPF